MATRLFKRTFSLLMSTAAISMSCPHLLQAQDSEESDRISYLEEQVRDLVGKMEEVQHELKTLKQAPAPTPETAPTASVDDQKETPPQDEDVPSVSEDSSQELPTGSAQEAYDHAVSLINKGEYAKAEAALNKFIKAHPKHALVVNAQYWIGETHLARKEYKQAALAFAKTYKAYKTDMAAGKKASSKQSFAKAPEALIKLAFALKGLGKRTEASATLTQLHKEFPQLPKGLQRLAEKAQNGL